MMAKRRFEGEEELFIIGKVLVQHLSFFLFFLRLCCNEAFWMGGMDGSMDRETIYWYKYPASHERAPSFVDGGRWSMWYQVIGSNSAELRCGHLYQ